jgi:hypothetical protein
LWGLYSYTLHFSVEGVTCGRGEVNGGDEGEGIWLMGFTDVHIDIDIDTDINMK